jgi:HSP20 family protein
MRDGVVVERLGALLRIVEILIRSITAHAGLEDKLHVSGTKGSTSVSEKSVLHRGERTSGKFARAVRLPKQVDADHIQASLKHGVLHVRLPKVPKPSSRQIEIRVAD